MDNKDIIDVEVIEEVIISDPVNVEEVISYTDEEIDDKLILLKEELVDNNYQVNDSINVLAKQIAINSKDYLDNDTYLWVMYAYALKYNIDNNKNAERFCFIRMKDILDNEKGKGKQPKALTFKQNTLTDAIEEEVEVNTGFIQASLQSVRKQFLMMELVILMIFICLLLFVFRYDILSTLLFSSIVIVFNFVFTYRSLVKKFLVNQTNTSKSYCNDEELLEFDRPVALS